MNELYPKLHIIMIWAIPVLFAITVHEVAHGWVANKLGDKTALVLGRITLNPFKHIDLLGTIVVPVIFLWLGGFIFGWAKPVPVNWRNLRNPKRDMAMVAMAGPLTNFIMAIIWAMIAKLALIMVQHGNASFKLFVYMGQAGIAINLMLMLLNLIPIPPLDGSRVLSAFLPTKTAIAYEGLEHVGFLILLGLIFVGALGVIMQPPMQFLTEILHRIFLLPY